MTSAVEPTIDVRVPEGSTWRRPYAVRITGNLETITALHRVLLGWGTLGEHGIAALAGTMFHSETGWVRVAGGWVHWNRNKEKDRILLAFLDGPKEMDSGNSR